MTLRDRPVVTFIHTRDRTRAQTFYREQLGLRLIAEDDFAVTYDVNGATMRLTDVADFTPHGHTVLGWTVDDIHASVAALIANGVVFNVYDGFDQDASGIWTAPGGGPRVAWFNDPDGNNLSITER